MFGWLYTIHEKVENGPLHVHWNVSQADIVAAMAASARFKPGQWVQLAPLVRRRILKRKWSFERGLFFYLLEGARPGSPWSIAGDELEQRIKAAEEELA